MEDKIYFTVDLTKEAHQKAFSPEQNGEIYEIVAYKQFIQLLAEKGINTSWDTIKYAASKNYLDYIKFDNVIVVILSPKTLAWKPGDNYSDNNKLAKMEIKKEPLNISTLILKNGSKVVAKHTNNEYFYESVKEKHYVLMRGDKKIMIKFKREVADVVLSPQVS